MSPSEHAPLTTKLVAESAAWQALLAALEQEEQALIDGEADRLPKLIAAKLTHLQTLNQLAGARHKELLASGLSSDPAGMDAWLARQGKPELHAQWEKLQMLDQQAQALNQRIGVLIDMRLNATRQALNVLVQAATSKGGLYDQAGCSVASRNGKPLTAA